MENFIEIRIRHPKGSHLIDDLKEDSSINDLKTAIAKLLNTSKSSLILKKGYPPRIFELPESTTLSNCEIYSGETIIVEIDEKRAALEPIPRHQDKIKSYPNEQIPNKDGMIMIRRIIPADNSCLFNAIAYAIENKSKDKAEELREVIAAYVSSDPQKYDHLLLEKSNEDYCKWILKDTSWGGAIELDILSKHYNIEICAIDILSLTAQIFGQDQGFSKRIYVLYDGIHYDILVRNISEEMDLMPDITVFSKDDKYAFDGVMWIAYDLNKKKQFTDVGNFTLECGVCYQKFAGEKDAVKHNKDTGHANFHEVSKGK